MPTTGEFNLKCRLLQLTNVSVPQNSFYCRTLMSAVLIIQYNQFIQTQGDRLIRVGCIFGNQTKVLVGAGVKISS